MGYFFGIGLKTVVDPQNALFNVLAQFFSILTCGWASGFLVLISLKATNKEVVKTGFTESMPQGFFYKKRLLKLSLVSRGF